jgi:RNA polymerase sigma-70 factor (ECF subfamily)
VPSAGVYELIQAGDIRRAASTLVASYGPDVHATCVAMVRDRTAAEDITQEVFADALRALKTFRGDASPRTWLLSIARNRCIDYLRARKRDPWGGALDDSAPDPDAHADEGAFGTEWHADRLILLRALDALAEGDRALVILRFKNGLDYDELGAAFGLRAATVRMRVSRALARMRQVLQPNFLVRSVGAVPMRARVAAPATAPPAAPAPELMALLRTHLGGDLGGHGRATAAGAAASGTPIGALGVALVACEPGGMSEGLAARLEAMVGEMAG